MPSAQVVVPNELGLHARAAAKLVEPFSITAWPWLTTWSILPPSAILAEEIADHQPCLLYTSDAADDSVLV